MTEKLLTIPCPRCNGTGEVDVETFGQRLTAVRLLHGMSRKILAEKTNGKISANNIMNIESGHNTNPSKDALIAISDVLGVSIDYLLKGTSK